jgi:hypothetical protein
MTSFVRALVSRLLAEDHEGIRDGLSRNRHFEVFADEQGRAAHRAYRRLRGLVHDIRASPAPIAVDRRAGERPVRLRIPLPGGTRTAYLSEEELALLLDAADVSARLVS